MKKLKSSNGFTLVELIVVIAMLAILSSVSIGGFEYSQKRAAIQNDKALVKQLNQVLDSYSIFTHNEGAIHDALIEELGDTIEIQSLKFGYDIYYIEDMYEFELRVQTGNDGKKNLHYYLNYKNDDSFYINTTYIKNNGDNTYSQINQLTNNEGFEYELEVGINLEFDENNATFISKNHQIILNDIVVKTSNDIELEYSITKISEVVYENTNFSQPTINDGKITFYYPGNYTITITDGITQEIIKVTILNICSLYSELSKLTSMEKSLFKHPELTNNDDGSYNFLLPILSYIRIVDYHYNKDIVEFEYYDTNTSIEEYYDQSQQKNLIDSKRLQITLNNDAVDFVYQNNKWYAIIPNLTLEENTITLIYKHLGANGKWSEPITQTLTLTNKNNNISVTLQE